MNIRCQRCNRATVRVGVSLFLDIPAEMYARLSKKNLVSAQVQLKGAGWDRAYFYCEYLNCGWNTHLTEVDVLRRELTTLRKEVGESQ
jgi:hypothetical protein